MSHSLTQLLKGITIRREDVLAAWTGIRPLVRDPAATNTAALVRNHMLNVSPSGLLTIAGGKWTTYRAMASHTIDMAIDVFGNIFAERSKFILRWLRNLYLLDLPTKKECVTEDLPLVGSEHWSPTMFIKLAQTYGLETEVRKF